MCRNWLLDTEDNIFHLRLTSITAHVHTMEGRVGIWGEREQLWFTAKMASLKADEMVQGKGALKHISNGSHFNLI